MATGGNYALRLPASVMKELKQRAKQEGSSVNQFIVVAVAEKLAVLRTHEYFAQRAARAAPGDFERILARTGGEAPGPGDELPDGWLEESGSDEATSRTRGTASSLLRSTHPADDKS